jgi:hypothetical protein
MKSYIFTADGLYEGNATIMPDHIQVKLIFDLPKTSNFGVMVFVESEEPAFAVDIIHRDNKNITLKRGMASRLAMSTLDGTSFVTYPTDGISDQFNKLVDVGILERIEKGSVLVCPDCFNRGFYTSYGCVNCGSSNIETTMLVHHFACGHVAQSEHFQDSNGVMTCPKCQKTNLIVNVDFDYSSGVAVCNDCNKTSASSVLVGDCHCCETKFCVSEAYQSGLVSYSLEDNDYYDAIISILG